jgi:hypothetical protein
MISAPTRERDGWSRVTVTAQIPADARVGDLLTELASVPSLHVVGLTWSPVEREGRVDLVLTLAAQVAP